ncbi:hypothetical protein RB653_008571 [Dictyostelium firmibasis]|uniref:Transmembrane protein n=1 Tax=Dictyostelium firmibasis TaxID=79012 RepID=A0AAN7YRB7_9MYCE
MFNFNKCINTSFRAYKKLANGSNNVSKLIINNKDNSKLLSSTSPLSNGCANNNKNNGIKFYSTKPPIPPIPPTQGNLRSYLFLYHNVDKGNGSYSNILLDLIGLAIVGTSLMSLIMYYFDSGKQDDEYMFRILNYFPSTPPFKLMDRNGYIKKLVREYKEGTITPAGLKVIGLIASTLDGDKYLLKYDMFDIVCEKIISKKDLVLNRSDPDFFILYRLAFNSKKAVPNEIVQKTEKNHIFRFLEENQKSLSDLEGFFDSFKIKYMDVILAGLVAAPIITLGIFRNRVSPAVVFKSVGRSSLVTSVAISAPLLKEQMNQHLFNECENYTCHALKSQIPMIAYGSLLVYLSTLPFVSWVLPICTTLALTKSYDGYKYYSKIAGYLRKKQQTNLSVEKTIE